MHTLVPGFLSASIRQRQEKTLENSDTTLTVRRRSCIELKAGSMYVVCLNEAFH